MSERFLVNIFLTITDIAETKVSLEIRNQGIVGKLVEQQIFLKFQVLVLLIQTIKALSFCQITLPGYQISYQRNVQLLFCSNLFLDYSYFL